MSPRWQGLGKTVREMLLEVFSMDCGTLILAAGCVALLLVCCHRDLERLPHYCSFVPATQPAPCCCFPGDDVELGIFSFFLFFPLP